MRLDHLAEQNVQWTIGGDSEPSYNLKFKDVTKIKMILSTVNSLISEAKIQTNPSVVESTSENVAAKQQKEVDHPRQSEMAIEGFSHKSVLLTKEKMAHYSVAKQQSVVYYDPCINLSEVDAGVDQEPENAAAPNVATDDLLDMNDPQQESSKYNIVTGNVASKSVKGSEVHCSETDDEPIDYIDHTQSVHAVNVPPNLNLSSRSQEVSTYVLCIFHVP